MARTKRVRTKGAATEDAAERGSGGRLRQLALVWRQLREVDGKAVWLVLAGGVLGAGVGTTVGVLVGPLWTIPLWALPLALLGALIVFNWRAQRAQYAALEGLAGAAAAVLERMRGQWILRPVVAYSSKQDLVHRVVGRCGVVLVGEGAPARVRSLLSQEAKRLSKVVGDVPVTTVLVGDGEGEVPLNRLQVHLARLPRKLGRSDVGAVERRLRPLDRALPIPKGIDPGAGSRPRPRPR
jgi:hypothetical protein